MDTAARIYVAGHRGMVGSALVRLLERKGYHHLLLRSRRDLDLRDHRRVTEFFDQTRPEYVLFAAAKVGGILANSTYPADFIYDNLAIQTNVIHAAYVAGVKKLLFLGSSCIYPRECPQPIKEDYLLTGPLEPTNEWYAVAKIAGIKMCQAYRKQYGCDFIAAMPTNLYGPGDNFDLETSHVLPALLRKIHEAKTNGKPAQLWGTGKPRREFLHVDDCAEACMALMARYSDSQIINIGAGEDISIAELAVMIAGIAAYTGAIEWDHSKPDGMPRKLLDSRRINAMGWRPGTRLQEGLQKTYDWYVNQVGSGPKDKTISIATAGL